MRAARWHSLQFIPHGCESSPCEFILGRFTAESLARFISKWPSYSFMHFCHKHALNHGGPQLSFMHSGLLREKNVSLWVTSLSEDEYKLTRHNHSSEEHHFSIRLNYDNKQADKRIRTHKKTGPQSHFQTNNVCLLKSPFRFSCKYTELHEMQSF